MNPSRFDAIAKSVARQSTRRQMLRFLGGGGVLAAAGNGGRTVVSAAAQRQTCTLAFNGAVRLGPSASELIAGGKTAGALVAQLTFGIDGQGALSQGNLQVADGTSFPFVGQATGRALNARVDFGNGLVLVAVGTADQDLTTCQGKIDGMLTGPQTGDLGDWHGTLSGGAATGVSTPETNAGTTAAPPSESNQPVAPPAVATVTETETAVSCPPCQQAASGACQPVAEGTTCGASTICCGGACIDPASDAANCGACGNQCKAGVATCVSGICRARENGIPPTRDASTAGCDPGQTLCSGFCANLTNDASNCGSCGHACGANQVCQASTCVNAVPHG